MPVISYHIHSTELRGLDAAVAKMQLICQVDDSQYAIMRDFKPIPCGAEQRGYFPVKENSLGLSMVCLIDEDVGQSQ